jgi:hypothetical protein
VERSSGHIPKTLSNGYGLFKYPRLILLLLLNLNSLLILGVGSTVDVERVFSCGCIILSYLRNRLKVQTVRSILCVGEWSRAGLLKDKDMQGWLKGLKDTDEEDERDVAGGWDAIPI